MTKHSAARFETWMHSRWRPMMGWMYMLVCIFDFILFPIGFTYVQVQEKHLVSQQLQQWVPLTMSGAGLFHMAMGAILGIYVWSRGQEKMHGVNGMPMPQYPGMQTPRPQNYDYEAPTNKDPVVDSEPMNRRGMKYRSNPDS